jgi:hypothetical protein
MGHIIGAQRGPYYFTIQVMLFNHHSIHGLGVLEGEEAKSSRTTSGTITHYSAFLNLTKLGEISFE